MRFYKFNRRFARQMLNVETYHQHPGIAMLQFLLQTLFIVGIVSVAKQTGGGQLLVLILDDMDAAKGYHAAVISGDQKFIVV